MAPTITREVLECYLRCPYKAYLKLRGRNGSQTEYERILISSRKALTQQAVRKIRERYPADDISLGIPLTTAALQEGTAFMLSPTLEDESISITFDALQKVPGPSELGSFHYIPVLFNEGRRAQKEQRLLLEMCAMLLSRLQRRQPERGVIWCGPDCKTSTIRLNLDLRNTERRLRELKELVSSPSVPRLILNNHCQACEFRSACTTEAKEADDISLLRGIGKKEITRFAKKGIFSVTQLAHTFRPKRGKRASRVTHRYHALQALAVKDQRVYVFGTPQLPDAPARVYLDVEGNPDERFDYLLGMIIVQGNEEQRFSFWADTKDQEEQIVGQLLEALTPYHRFAAFAYGSYEATFLKRMLKRHKLQKPLEKVLDSLVNVLSIIYSHLYFPTGAIAS